MGNSKSKQNKLGLVLPDLSNQPGQPRVSLAHDRMSPFHAENTEAVSDEVVLNLSCKLGTFTLGFYGLEFIDEAVAATTGAAIPNSAKNSSIGSLRAFLFSFVWPPRTYVEEAGN